MARAPGDLLEGEGSLVIRHAGRLSTARLQALWIALAAGRQQVLRVAVTLSQGPAAGDLAGLLKYFPGAAELPPLRHHVEDPHQLVPYFPARLNPDGPPACSPEPMHPPLRSNWPGSTGQPWQVLRRAARHRRTGTIHPADLPPGCRSVSRRLLSPPEPLERDATAQTLPDHHGSKAKAAGSPGMSRATIYRTIHEHGIITPAS